MIQELQALPVFIKLHISYYESSYRYKNMNPCKMNQWNWKFLLFICFKDLKTNEISAVDVLHTSYLILKSHNKYRSWLQFLVCCPYHYCCSLSWQVQTYSKCSDGNAGNHLFPSPRYTTSIFSSRINFWGYFVQPLLL